MARMLEAMAWAALATGTLLIGMWLSFQGLVNQRWTGLLMAFGAGAIVSAVAYQLIPGPVLEGDRHFIALAGTATGALVFYFGDRWVESLGGGERMDTEGAQASGSGTGILLGSLLDGVPESLVLGLSLVHSPDVSIAFIAAVAVSNVPQGLGGTTGMLAAGWSRTKVSRLWLAVCVASIVAAALGYGIGEAFDGATGAFADTFAAGALLVMLTNSMIPEAFEEGRNEAGLLFALGFGVALALTVAQL
jgi:ZIP family zinc transporter